MPYRAMPGPRPRPRPRRVASHRAKPAPRHAMPMSCRSTLFSRSRPRPSSRLRSQQWKCIDRRMAERASGPVFPHSLPLSLSQSFSPSRARHPAVSFPISARPSPRASFPPISFSNLLQSIFFSSETHFPRLPAACLCLFLPPLPPLSLCLSLFYPLRRRCPRPHDPDGDALVLVATLVAVHVDYHPSCRLAPFTAATHRGERKYLCRCIASRFLSLRGIPACDQYSCCQRNCQSYMLSI